MERRKRIADMTDEEVASMDEGYEDHPSHVPATFDEDYQEEAQQDTLREPESER